MNKNLGNAISIFGSGLRDMAIAGGLGSVAGVATGTTSPIITYIAIGCVVVGGVCGVLGKAINIYINGTDTK